MSLHPSEIARNEAQARMFEAEMEKNLRQAEFFATERDKNKQVVAVASMEREMREFAQREMLAADSKHHVFRFIGEVDDHSTQTAISRLASWSRQDPGCDIEFVITSPGGSIVDGFALFDFIVDLRRRGHNITTVASGMAASMGGVLLQAGSHRIAKPGASILIHEGSLIAWGAAAQVDDTVEWGKKLRDRIVDIFVERGKLTKAQFVRKWQRTDWWITADEALEYGFVDEVA